MITNNIKNNPNENRSQKSRNKINIQRKKNGMNFHIRKKVFLMKT
jgi:hypothetical protein